VIQKPGKPEKRHSFRIGLGVLFQVFDGISPFVMAENHRQTGYSALHCVAKEV